MADKVCATCGAQVPAAAVFCTQCGGRELNEATPGWESAAATGSAVEPDSPTVPVAEDHQPPPMADPPTMPVSPTTDQPTMHAPPSAPEPPTIAEQPTMADQPTVAADPTMAWSTPPGPAPAPAYAPGASTQAAPAAAAPPREAGGGKFGAAVVLLGGAAAIAGAFLEWMTITPDGGSSVGLNGWELTDDAKIAAAIGAVAVITAVVALGTALRAAARVVAGIAGIGLIGLGAFDTWDILQRLPGALEDAGVTGVEIGAPGIGLILVLAGGAVVVLGALAMMAGSEKSDPDAQASTMAPGAPPSGYQPQPGPQGPPQATQIPPYPAPQPGPPPGGYAPPGPPTAPPGGGYGSNPGGQPPPTQPYA